MMLPWQRRPKDLNSPRDLPNLALWLDAKDVSSLRNNAGTQPVTTDGIKLASDKSGNSSVNVLCLNGVAGNYVSSPSTAALNIANDIELVARLSCATAWTTGNQAIITKYLSTGNQRSYWFALNSGALQLVISTTGSDFPLVNSSATVPFTAFQTGWVKVTRVKTSGTVQFFTAPDSSTEPTVWTQLGTDQTLSAGNSQFASTALLNIGSIDAGVNIPLSANVYRAIVRNGIGGTTVFDANFATAAKLAPSFTESSSNAATVTINTSGATGARISGARDLYQGTAANQPILTIAAAGNYLTFDGSNDYLKAAAFGLAQPETVYFVGSQVTWTSGDYLYDGGGSSSMALVQNTSTPTLALLAGSAVAQNGGFPVATLGVVSSIYSGASSSLRINRGTPTTGNSGSGTPNGFTVGSAGGGTAWANITAQEVLVYSGAHDKATQDRVIAYLANRNRIALT